MVETGQIRDFINLAAPNRNLYLVLDGKGAILEILSDPSGLIDMAGSTIKAERTLAPYFDFSVLPGDEPVILTQIPGTDLCRGLLSLHSLLPQHSLRLARLPDNRFLGRLSLFEFQIMAATLSYYNYIWVDHRNDVLIGFTDWFYRHFRRRYASPSAMLGLPMSRFFKPSPLEFQNTLPPRDTADKEIARVHEGFPCENTGQTPSVIPLPGTVNTAREDFTLSVTVDVLAGQDPIFMLGEKGPGSQALPDELAYSAGPSVGEGPAYAFWLIKRNGYVVHSAPRGPGTQTRAFVFEKTGNALLLSEGGRILVKYMDADFLHYEKAILGLCLRPGTRCLVRRVEIRTRKAAASPGERPVITVLSDTERLCWMDPLFNAALSQPTFYHVSGFILNDITEIQERLRQQEQRYRSLLKQVRREGLSFIGESPALKAVRDTARLAAGSSATVLIEGPTGSGKEVIAHYIHDQSPRKNGPFIKVDCATVPAPLIESHLFGHEKGAFTGATSRNIGMLETADKGTLFLDEAGNLTTEVQAKLLQFLNDFSITRVGGVKPIRLDVRVAAASNTPLESLVKAGRFRQDLYYRLNVVYIKTPPLSERREDIAPLSRHFLAQFASEQGRAISDFTPGALRKLESHAWPGNVRELSNAIQRAVIFCQEKTVDADHIRFLQTEEQSRGRRPSRAPFRLSKTSKEEVVRALAERYGKAGEAAEALGMGRATLYKFLKRNKIDPDQYRKGFRVQSKFPQGLTPSVT